MVLVDQNAIDLAPIATDQRPPARHEPPALARPQRSSHRVHASRRREAWCHEALRCGLPERQLAALAIDMSEVAAKLDAALLHGEARFQRWVGPRCQLPCISLAQPGRPKPV